MRRTVSPGVWTVLFLALGVLLWQGMANAGRVNPFFFSSPALIWREFCHLVVNGQLVRHLSITLTEAGLGLLFGGVLGTLAGLALGTHPKVSRGLMPLLTGLNGLPKLALGPLIIIWFGIGLKSKVLIAGLMVFFIFLFNAFSGVRSVDRDLITGVRLLGATDGHILQKVLVPACIPWLLTSLRTSLGISLSGAIVGEFLGAGKGIGWFICSAGERYDTTQVLCCVIVLVVLVILMDGVVRFLERRLLRWREEPLHASVPRPKDGK